jgi:hypothetical protein
MDPRDPLYLMRSGRHVARGVASPRCKREGSQPTCSTKGPKEDAVTTVTCAPTESIPRREGRAWHRERLRCNAERHGARRAGATRCSPGVRTRQSGEEQRAIAGVARGDSKRHSFRKRCQRVWRSIVAKHAGVLGPGHGCARQNALGHSAGNQRSRGWGARVAVSGAMSPGAGLG